MDKLDCWGTDHYFDVAGYMYLEGEAVHGNIFPFIALEIHFCLLKFQDFRYHGNFIK